MSQFYISNDSEADVQRCNESTSGDQIAAESYLQHAEHYNRLIAAAQEQFGQ